MNFPKHLFEFPHASYSTNGNEALSLLLFSYRFEYNLRFGLPVPVSSEDQPYVLYVVAENEPEPNPDIASCTIRLGMRFQVMTNASFKADKRTRGRLSPEEWV